MKNNLPPFIEIYRALIATPSISATEEALDQSNESLINLLAGWFRDLGFNVEIQPVPDTRHKFNLLASTGHGAGGLLLAGHTDTVPFDDGRWTRDPFTLTEHDNKLYGLGTADMKGFFAFILDALRDVDVTTLKKPLYILATADEETSMAGALLCRNHPAAPGLRHHRRAHLPAADPRPQRPYVQRDPYSGPVRPLQRSGARGQRD